MFLKLTKQKKKKGKEKSDTYSDLNQLKIFVLVSVTKSCSTFCTPLDCNPPGPSVHGILQARILECALPCPLPGDLPDPQFEAMSLTSLALGRQVLYH